MTVSLLCYGLLERAERKIEVLLKVDSDGGVVAEPFGEPSDEVDEPGELF